MRFFPLVLLLVAALQGCDRSPNATVLSGATMGTTWSLVLPSPPGPITLDVLNQAIESELVRVNSLMSTYQADSELSQFNSSSSISLQSLHPEILYVLDAANKISESTNGSYDVTLGAVIDLWGFGASDQQAKPTDQQIKDAASATGYDRLKRSGNKLSKPHPNTRVDLSSIAKGYAVDRIGLIAERAGMSNYLAEIGGEIRARGQRAKNKLWRVGIETPNLEVQQGIAVTDTSVASSGSYRNYRELDGKRISHLIDGQTHQPITHHTAAVTVLHRNTMLADAWATALMVLPPEDALALVDEHGLEVQFTYKNGDDFEVWRTPGFSKLLIKQ